MAFFLQRRSAMELSEILDMTRPIYAHTPSEADKEEKQKETLEEHTKRCEKYFLRLLEKEGMREAFQTMEPVLLGEVPEKYVEWFRSAVFGVISFHDTGKVNPKFQVEVMGNAAFQDVKIRSLNDSNHSLLSAYIYWDYFLNRLNEIVKECAIDVEKWKCLYDVLLLNVYVIMKHHSSLDEYKDMINATKAGGKLSNLDKHMIQKEFRQIYRGKFSQISIEKSVQMLSDIEDLEERKFAKYTYIRLMFSLLTACDYYATNEYVTGAEISYFGSVQEIDDLRAIYEQTDLAKKIREFQPETAVDDGEDINYLRKKLFYEAENNLQQNLEDDVFFLEAPTGCGKSNVAFASSFLLAKQGMGKIIYVYPFNNLVEQNKASIEEIFKGHEVLKDVAVVNSITPIKCEIDEKKKYQDETLDYYKKALLDRQFLNYPVILTTHVNLFQTMFGTQREAAFGFHQLVGSVIVLDEIQSYKNTLWTEIMMFLQYFCKYLHAKVLIMSATLPDLTLLTGKEEKVRRLIQNRDYYFQDKRFQGRVQISYELLQKEFDEVLLYEHIKNQAAGKKKIVVEFIKKEMAYRFYERFKEDEDMMIPIERMTGDDNTVDRQEILRKIKDVEYCKNGFILVATQVIEAGVDIDMDIGYKDTSILDSEEQFMGRINRNAKRNGMVYFFNLCDAGKIYGKNDIRSSANYTLQNEEMQEVLVSKDFSKYYEKVLGTLQHSRNQSSGDEGIRTFVDEEVGKLDFRKVENRMQLIDEDCWTMSVFLAREIKLPSGECVDGQTVWEQYSDILQKPQEDYAEFRVRLSQIKSHLNLFIYKIKKNSKLPFNDRIGELYYLENGEDFFEDEKLNKAKLEDAGGLFIEI